MTIFVTSKRSNIWAQFGISCASLILIFSVNYFLSQNLNTGFNLYNDWGKNKGIDYAFFALLILAIVTIILNVFDRRYMKVYRT
jgi:magnesium-transporting ATPase (P-type)